MGMDGYFTYLNKKRSNQKAAPNYEKSNNKVVIV